MGPVTTASGKQATDTQSAPTDQVTDRNILDCLAELKSSLEFDDLSYRICQSCGGEMTLIVTRKSAFGLLGPPVDPITITVTASGKCIINILFLPIEVADLTTDGSLNVNKFRQILWKLNGRSGYGFCPGFDETDFPEGFEFEEHGLQVLAHPFSRVQSKDCRVFLEVRRSTLRVSTQPLGLQLCSFCHKVLADIYEVHKTKGRDVGLPVFAKYLSFVNQHASLVTPIYDNSREEGSRRNLSHCTQDTKNTTDAVDFLEVGENKDGPEVKVESGLNSCSSDAGCGDSSSNNKQEAKLKRRFNSSDGPNVGIKGGVGIKDCSVRLCRVDRDSPLLKFSCNFRSLPPSPVSSSVDATSFDATSSSAAATTLSSTDFMAFSSSNSSSSSRPVLSARIKPFTIVPSIMAESGYHGNETAASNSTASLTTYADGEPPVLTPETYLSPLGSPQLMIDEDRDYAEPDLKRQCHRCAVCAEAVPSLAGLEHHMTQHHHHHHLNNNNNSFAHSTTTTTNNNDATTPDTMLYEHSTPFSDQRQNSPPLSKKCPICRCVFGKTEELEDHLQHRHGARLHPCRFCGQKFAGKKSLADHLEKHRGSKMTCKECGQQFAKKKLFAAHVKEHMGNFPYFCTVCSKFFSRERAYEDHLARHRTRQGAQSMLQGRERTVQAIRSKAKKCLEEKAMISTDSATKSESGSEKSQPPSSLVNSSENVEQCSSKLSEKSQPTSTLANSGEKPPKTSTLANLFSTLVEDELSSASDGENATRKTQISSVLTSTALSASYISAASLDANSPITVVASNFDSSVSKAAERAPLDSATSSSVSVQSGVSSSLSGSTVSGFTTTVPIVVTLSSPLSKSPLITQELNSPHFSDISAAEDEHESLNLHLLSDVVLAKAELDGPIVISGNNNDSQSVVKSSQNIGEKNLNAFDRGEKAGASVQTTESHVAGQLERGKRSPNIQSLLNASSPSAHKSPSPNSLQSRSKREERNVWSSIDVPLNLMTGNRHAQTTLATSSTTVCASEASQPSSKPSLPFDVQIMSSPHQVMSSPHQVTSSPHQFTSSSHQVTSSPHQFTSSPHQFTSSPHQFMPSPHDMLMSRPPVPAQQLSRRSVVAEQLSRPVTCVERPVNLTDKSREIAVTVSSNQAPIVLLTAKPDNQPVASPTSAISFSLKQQYPVSQESPRFGMGNTGSAGSGSVGNTGSAGAGSGSMGNTGSTGSRIGSGPELKGVQEQSLQAREERVKQYEEALRAKEIAMTKKNMLLFQQLVIAHMAQKNASSTAGSSPGSPDSNSSSTSTDSTPRMPDQKKLFQMFVAFNNMMGRKVGPPFPGAALGNLSPRFRGNSFPNGRFPLPYPGMAVFTKGGAMHSNFRPPPPPPPPSSTGPNSSPLRPPLTWHPQPSSPSPYTDSKKSVASLLSNKLQNSTVSVSSKPPPAATVTRAMLAAGSAAEKPSPKPLFSQETLRNGPAVLEELMRLEALLPDKAKKYFPKPEPVRVPKTESVNSPKAGPSGVSSPVSKENSHFPPPPPSFASSSSSPSSLPTHQFSPTFSPKQMSLLSLPMDAIPDKFLAKRGARGGKGGKKTPGPGSARKGSNLSCGMVRETMNPVMPIVPASEMSRLLSLTKPPSPPPAPLPQLRPMTFSIHGEEHSSSPARSASASSRSLHSPASERRSQHSPVTHRALYSPNLESISPPPLLSPEQAAVSSDSVVDTPPVALYKEIPFHSSTPQSMNDSDSSQSVMISNISDSPRSNDSVSLMECSTSQPVTSVIPFSIGSRLQPQPQLVCSVLPPMSQPVPDRRQSERTHSVVSSASLSYSVADRSVPTLSQPVAHVRTVPSTMSHPVSEISQRSIATQPPFDKFRSSGIASSAVTEKLAQVVSDRRQIELSQVPPANASQSGPVAAMSIFLVASTASSTPATVPSAKRPLLPRPVPSESHPGGNRNTPPPPHPPVSASPDVPSVMTLPSPVGPDFTQRVEIPDVPQFPQQLDSEPMDLTKKSKGKESSTARGSHVQQKSDHGKSQSQPTHDSVVLRKVLLEPPVTYDHRQTVERGHRSYPPALIQAQSPDHVSPVNRQEAGMPQNENPQLRIAPGLNNARTAALRAQIEASLQKAIHGQTPAIKSEGFALLRHFMPEVIPQGLLDPAPMLQQLRPRLPGFVGQQRMTLASPPQYARPESFSPPRQARSETFSPPRHARSETFSPPRHARSETFSPPRHARSETLSPPRNTRPESFSPPHQPRLENISPAKDLSPRPSAAHSGRSSLSSPVGGSPMGSPQNVSVATSPAVSFEGPPNMTAPPAHSHHPKPSRSEHSSANPSPVGSPLSNRPPPPPPFTASNIMVSPNLVLSETSAAKRASWQEKKKQTNPLAMKKSAEKQPEPSVHPLGGFAWHRPAAVDPVAAERQMTSGDGQGHEGQRANGGQSSAELEKDLAREKNQWQLEFMQTLRQAREKRQQQQQQQSQQQPSQQNSQERDVDSQQQLQHHWRLSDLTEHQNSSQHFQDQEPGQEFASQAPPPRQRRGSGRGRPRRGAAFVDFSRTDRGLLTDSFEGYDPQNPAPVTENSEAELPEFLPNGRKRSRGRPRGSRGRKSKRPNIQEETSETFSLMSQDSVSPSGGGLQHSMYSPPATLLSTQSQTVEYPSTQHRSAHSPPVSTPASLSYPRPGDFPAVHTQAHNPHSSNTTPTRPPPDYTDANVTDHTIRTELQKLQFPTTRPPPDYSAVSSPPAHRPATHSLPSLLPKPTSIASAKPPQTYVLRKDFEQAFVDSIRQSRENMRHATADNRSRPSASPESLPSNSSTHNTNFETQSEQTRYVLASEKGQYSISKSLAKSISAKLGPKSAQRTEEGSEFALPKATQAKTTLPNFLGERLPRQKEGGDDEDGRAEDSEGFSIGEGEIALKFEPLEAGVRCDSCGKMLYDEQDILDHNCDNK